LGGGALEVREGDGALDALAGGLGGLGPLQHEIVRRLFAVGDFQHVRRVQRLEARRAHRGLVRSGFHRRLILAVLLAVALGCYRAVLLAAGLAQAYFGVRDADQLALVVLLPHAAAQGADRRGAQRRLFAVGVALAADEREVVDGVPVAQGQGDGAAGV